MSQSDPSSFAALVSVSLTDGSDPARTTNARRLAGQLLFQAVGGDLHDDRFQPADQWPADGVLALAELDGRPVAYAASSISRGRLQLDTVVDTNMLSQSLGPPSSNVDAAAASVAKRLIDAVTEHYEREVFTKTATPPPDELIHEVWGRPRQPWHDKLAERLDLTPARTLFQMRCRLPLARQVASAIETRGLNVDADTTNLVDLNNRAFAFHPDQSSQTVDEVAAAFDTEGFQTKSVRVLDAEDLGSAPADPDRPMAGFCWTKIHPPTNHRPGLGEIYVIAVDPAYHGHGLGRGLTGAGLNWLADQDLKVGMLYVESDNKPAVRTYQKLGFDVHAQYTAWTAS